MTEKNTAALAAHHPENHLDMVGRWYMVNRDGMATLCTDRTDAEKEAADAQSVWPHMGPHRAVRLIEASFEAADMATAAAQGFRDGVASLAASAGELTPAHIKAMERAWQWMENQADGQSKGGHATFDLMMLREECDALRAAIDVAAPPTAQAGGWRPIETAPEGQMVVVGWLDKEDTETPERHDFDLLEDGCWQRWHDHAEHVQIIGGHGVSYTAPYTVWMPIGAIPPTSAEGVEHE